MRKKLFVLMGVGAILAGAADALAQARRGFRDQPGGFNGGMVRSEIPATNQRLPHYFDSMAEFLFRRYDQNGDGYLNYDEMPEALRSELKKWDKDGNGLIDLSEFKEYLKARQQQVQLEWSNVDLTSNPVVPSLPSAPAAEPDDKKPVVYRAGNLPKELPPWFAQYDTDGDGQISLSEWRAAGRTINEFIKMDRNNDGFLTIEEVLRYEKNRSGGSSAASGNGSGRASSGVDGGRRGRHQPPRRQQRAGDRAGSGGVTPLNNGNRTVR